MSKLTAPVPTILGFQLLNIHSGFVVLMLWVVGGLIALCGAWSYAGLLPCPAQEANTTTYSRFIIRLSAFCQVGYLLL